MYLEVLPCTSSRRTEYSDRSDDDDGGGAGSGRREAYV